MVGQTNITTCRVSEMNLQNMFLSKFDAKLLKYRILFKDILTFDLVVIGISIQNQMSRTNISYKKYCQKSWKFEKWYGHFYKLILADGHNYEHVLVL